MSRYRCPKEAAVFCSGSHLLAIKIRGRRSGDGPTAHQGRGFARARRHAAGLSPVSLRNNLVK